MPRTGRKAPGGYVYHVLNRGNGRKRLFHKPADYDAFVRLLAKYRQQVGMPMLAFCLMPNHWHLVLFPKHDGDLSSFMLRLTTAHVRRVMAHNQDNAGGHLYQGRFKSFPVQEDRHLLTVLRYVEANPLRAKMVRRSRDWRWSSLRGRTHGQCGGVPVADLLDEWPVQRPAQWERRVDEPLSEDQATQFLLSLRRGRPLGDEHWVEGTAKRLGLDFTLRPRGRPRTTEI